MDSFETTPPNADVQKNVVLEYIRQILSEEVEREREAMISELETTLKSMSVEVFCAGLSPGGQS